ncbi:MULTISPECIES: hypothetical protein [unclassified Mammaliicoccus]|uniref:hypothetical protein n=1 Tax=unclassified Mammaliicoccus TaxID=2803851 RepID=UPI001EFAAAC0|nr:MULTISPECIES: hypothetical protein [unclassified Mammaliicoccus]
MYEARTYYIKKKLPKHLRNRSVEQLTLRRDIARLCGKYTDTLTKKEMLAVVRDVFKGMKKYYKERD